MARKTASKSSTKTKPKTGTKRPVGRPTLYTHQLAAKICERLAKGETLRSICRDTGYPDESAVRQWALDDYNGFYTQYARARDIGLDAMADEILDIADTPKEGIVTVHKPSGKEERTGDMIEHRRLQVDTRKWYLSKLAPKRYDRPDISKPDASAIPDDYQQTLSPDEATPDAPIL